MQMNHLKLDFAKNIRSSFVVFLVALPLAMGVSIASGYPPVAGLITGIVGGVLVGLIGGAPLQVSGAAAGLTVIVFQGVQEFGLERMALVILMAGFLQAVAALLGMGKLFQAVSPTVIYAMLAGIGILIIASQIYVLMDLTPLGGGLENIANTPTLVSDFLWSQMIPFSVGVLSIFLMIFWPKVSRNKLKIIPAPLVAVIVCSVIAWIGNLQISYVSIPQDFLNSWIFGSFNFQIIQDQPKLILAAIQLALIASAESLLCVAAVDQMHLGARSKFNRELAAQGIGNAICGLLGALPMTGVIVRSSANVSAGATSRLSTILHGIWICLFVFFIPQVLSYVPISALAGILIYTGIKLVNIDEIKTLRRYGKSEILIYFSTVVVIVAYDLLFGVILGLAMSSINLLRQLSRLSISIEKKGKNETIVLNLTGAATFLGLPKFIRALETVPAGASVKVKSNLRLMDAACQAHFNTWQKRHKRNGGNIEVELQANA